MTFVPVVPVTETPPSPNTRELAGRLSATIRQFLESHPETTSAEIKQATRLATAGFTPSISGALVVVGLGLLFAAGLAVFLFARIGNFDPVAPGFPLILIALAVMALVGIFVALRR